jgi:hypothetical protein
VRSDDDDDGSRRASCVANGEVGAGEDPRSAFYECVDCTSQGPRLRHEINTEMRPFSEVSTQHSTRSCVFSLLSLLLAQNAVPVPVPALPNCNCRTEHEIVSLMSFWHGVVCLC